MFRLRVECVILIPDLWEVGVGVEGMFTEGGRGGGINRDLEVYVPSPSARYGGSQGGIL